MPAPSRGLKIFAETRVVDVVPLDGAEDGSCGYRVTAEKSTAFVMKQPQSFTCRGVVIAASALGSMELLFKLKDKKSLPSLSNMIGRYVRTNSESLIGVRVPDTQDDLSKGVAIGSGIHIDEHTHIEAVRYPTGSDSMSAWSTILTGGRPGPGRVAAGWGGGGGRGGGGGGGGRSGGGGGEGGGGGGWCGGICVIIVLVHLV